MNWKKIKKETPEWNTSFDLQLQMLMNTEMQAKSRSRTFWTNSVVKWSTKNTWMKAHRVSTHFMCFFVHCHGGTQTEKKCNFFNFKNVHD